jgi:hypothetical protein
VARVVIVVVIVPLFIVVVFVACMVLREDLHGLS